MALAPEREGERADLLDGLDSAGGAWRGRAERRDKDRFTEGVARAEGTGERLGVPGWEGGAEGGVGSVGRGRARGGGRRLWKLRRRRPGDEEGREGGREGGVEVEVEGRVGLVVLSVGVPEAKDRRSGCHARSASPLLPSLSPSLPPSLP
jgi:hypothetical protein